MIKLLQQTKLSTNTLNRNNAFKIKINPYMAINSSYVSINVMYCDVNYPKL